MATITATEARSKLYSLIDEAEHSHEPIVITGKRGNAVLVAESDWNAITETLYLLSKPMWELYFTKEAQKDAKKLSSAGLKDKAQSLLDVLRENPFQNPPPYEKLVGDLDGAFSRRINIQHRLIYQVYKEEKAVKILRMWSHYE